MNYASVTGLHICQKIVPELESNTSSQKTTLTLELQNLKSIF